MDIDNEIRDFKDLKRYKFMDENVQTVTSNEQIKTEKIVGDCFNRFEQLVCLDDTLPTLYRKEHIRYIESSIHRLSSSYECLDSSRPWLVYWILNSASLLKHKLSDVQLDQIIDFLVKCRCPGGGFAGGPGQYAHLAPTYAAVNSLCIIGTDRAFQAIDRKSLKNFLLAIREPNGAFRMHVDGEIDLRGAYCAISVSKLCCYSKEDEDILFENTVEWIVSCQTYEGGMGGAPDLEAHGGYAFCGVAALTLLGKIGKCDLNALLRWTVNRQMSYEGGFQGRTNKLVDGCYSFWQGAVLPIVQALIRKKELPSWELLKRPLFNRTALQEYILICCQRPNGGLVDKPGKAADLYHTCYTLSGLSIAQHSELNMNPVIIGCSTNEVSPTHPLHNIPPTCALSALVYFRENNYDMYCEENENGIWGDDEEDKLFNRRASKMSIDYGPTINEINDDDFDAVDQSINEVGSFTTTTATTTTTDDDLDDNTDETGSERNF